MSEYLSGDFENTNLAYPTIILNKTLYFDDEQVTSGSVDENPYEALEHYGGQVAILERTIKISPSNRNNHYSIKWLGVNNLSDAKNYAEKNGIENFEDAINKNFSGIYTVRAILDNPHFLDRMNERRKKIDHLEFLTILDEIVEDYEFTAEDHQLLKDSIYDIESFNRHLTVSMQNHEDDSKNRAYLNRDERSKMFEKARNGIIKEFNKSIDTIDEYIGNIGANSLTSDEINTINYYASELTESLRTNYELVEDTKKAISIIIEKLIMTSRLKHLGADFLSHDVLDDTNIWLDDMNKLIKFTNSQAKQRYLKEINNYIDSNHYWA